MKKLSLLLLLTTTGLSVKAQTSIDTLNSNWAYSSKVNEMTNDTSYYAETSDNTNKVTATLTVRYSNGKNEVLITANNGVLNFQSSSYQGIVFTTLTFKAKFDDDDIETWRANPSSDGSYRTGFIKAPQRFTKKLKKSKVTFIQVVIYNDGVYTFKFNTKNLIWDH